MDELHINEEVRTALKSRAGSLNAGARKQYRRTCAAPMPDGTVCGRVIEGINTKKYHSQACNQRAYRARQQSPAGPSMQVNIASMTTDFSIIVKGEGDERTAMFAADTHEHHEPPHRVMVEHFDPNDYDEGVAGSAPWVITINAAVAGFSLSFEEALLRARSFFLSDFKKELDGLLGSEDSE
jgi:hypothetical protein